MPGLFDDLKPKMQGLFSEPTTTQLLGMQLMANSGPSVGAPRNLFEGMPQTLMAGQQLEQGRRDRVAEGKLLAGKRSWLAQARPDLAAQVEGGLDFNTAYDQAVQDMFAKPDPIKAGSPLGKLAEDFQNGLIDEQTYQAALAKATQSNNGITITNPDGTVTQIGGSQKPLTEGQSKDTVYVTRAQGAAPILDEYESSLADGMQQGMDKVPFAGNYLTSDEFKKADNAGREFLQAILRKDTGAAITPEEMAQYGATYLPRPGDGPEIIAQKRAARSRAIQAIKAGMPAQAILAAEQALSDEAQTPQPQVPQEQVVDWTDFFGGQ